MTTARSEPYTLPRERRTHTVPTLIPHIRRYIDARVKAGELTRATAYRHEGALRDFAETFGRRPVERLSRADVERWIARQVAAGHKPSTRGLRLSILRGFLADLRRRKIIRSDPLDGVKRPKRPRSNVHVLTGEEVDRILAACPDARARAIVEVMYVLGARCVEVERLQIEDWHRVDQTMRLVGKGMNERVVPVPARVAAALDAYLAEHPASSGPLFRPYRCGAGEGMHANYVSALVRRWCREAGVKTRPFDGVSAHAFRRTAATELYLATGDLTAVQELLGHADLTSLRAYVERANVEKVRAALAQRLGHEPAV